MDELTIELANLMKNECQTIINKVGKLKVTTETIPKKNNQKYINKTKENIIDVCTIIEQCNIEEISKYLIKQGKKRGFPDITIRE